ncbi:helix-turn-helix domain-containing protein [Acidisphaera sp. S103]|uniref:AraC family transcriptional regulator n=1 Tax=Acidisphaera sp. S103 TaxID=1747223 RepID=UPI00131B278B|nr:helix-turn-helix transcriptional regulator [Acidisphaera sp. S103]
MTYIRPLIAVGEEFPDGHVIAPHQHRRCQLIFSASGALALATPQHSWVMPPQRGMWIPAGIMHDVRMIGAVTLYSLYLEPDMVTDMPGQCQIVSVSRLMRSLIDEVLDLPSEYDPSSRAGALMALIQHEMRRLPALPLSLPFPMHQRLAECCQQFLLKPMVHETIEEWSDLLGMSRRAFTRLFRNETGLTFMAWRQQACLINALPRLLAGEPVTVVAVDLGYNNPAAFTAMFKRVLGAPPRIYLHQKG